MKRSRADHEAGVTFFGLARRSFWLIFGGFWLVVGLPFLVAGVITGLEERRLWTEGRVVDGVVLGKEIGGRSGSERTYRVRYRFLTDEGREVDGTAAIGFAAWERLREREAIRIVYRPGRETKSRPEGETRWTTPAVFLTVGGIFAILGGSVLVRAAGQILARLRSAPPPITTQAVVTDVRPGGMTLNGRRPWHVHYRYHDHRGREHRGRSAALSEEEARRWQPGDRAAVSYRRDRPHKAVWLESA